MTWIVRMALVTMSVVALFAQQQQPRRPPAKGPSTAAKPKPIGPPTAPLREIQVKGNQHYKTEDIIAASGLRVGQRILETDFEPARERLMATGGFETISYRYQPVPNGDGYALTFEVLEVGRALPVRFEDLPIPDAELVKFLREKEPLFGGNRAPGNQAVLQRLAKELTDFLTPKGLKDPVAAQVIADNPGELSVLFRPNTPRPRVAQINFGGNRLLDTPTLANAFAIVSIGVEYKEQTVRTLLDTSIRPLYEARGYLGVQFPKITAKPKPEVQGLDVMIQVDEGKPYRYGQITATGAGIESKEIFSIAGLKPEEVSNFDSVNAVPKRLIERMQRDGYMQAKASFDRKIDDKNHLVHIQFKTEPGPVYTFNKLHIQGLDLHGEPAVRKFWGLKYGKPYNAEYPQRFLNEVKEQNMFDGLKETKYEIKLDDKAKTVDVLLTFK